MGIKSDSYGGIEVDSELKSTASVVGMFMQLEMSLAGCTRSGSPLLLELYMPRFFEYTNSSRQRPTRGESQ